MNGALRSPSLRIHLLIVGTVLFVAGGVALWLLPDPAAWWVVVSIVVVVTHIGLLMVVGAALLRWAAGRHRT